MNRSHLTQAIIWLTQIAEQAEAEAEKLRAQLTADARAEHVEQGTAPTWRIPDVATVSAMVSRPALTVVDEEAFTAWVRLRYPDAIVEQVSPSWRKTFLDTVDRDGPADPGTGEVVPGLRVRPGGQVYAMSIRPTAEARQVFALTAAEGLKHAAALAGPNVPVVLAELEAGEPA